MSPKKVGCLLVATSIGIGSTVFAQDNVTDYSNRRGPHGLQRDTGRLQQPDMSRQQGRRDAGRRDDWRDHGRGDGREGAYSYGARGPEWRRGGRVPQEYRNHQYVVQDWQSHHLHRPPPGHQWVQVGGDYVLIAIATGIITELILNNQ